MAVVGLSLLLAAALALLACPSMLSRWLGARASDPAATPATPATPVGPDDGRASDDGDATPGPPPVVDGPSSPTTPRAPARPQASPGPVPALSLSDAASPPLPARPSTRARLPAAGPLPRRGPVPARRARPAAPASGLAASAARAAAPPQQPRRRVVLDPGCSPLNWARLAGGGADLRGLGPAAPYLRVPPSLLKRHTGRAGKDAWVALNGNVYNVTPYARFHPGGVPELMRGAGRDATALFGEVHPWVNYETMLAACLVGLLVDEAEAEADMDQMD